jgi:hypothetical protein
MDSTLWESSWFLDLSPEHKNIWQYLERSCDCAGIWEIDIPQLKRKIGYTDINLSAFLTEVNKDYDKLTGYSILRIQNSSKIETVTTISNPCQPLPRVKDKDSSSLNISLFESRIKTELISEYGRLCRP